MLPNNWPHWIVIPIGFALAIASIGVALVLEPAVQSLAQHPEPTPTLPCLDYAAPLSVECIACHTDRQQIETLAASVDEADSLFIEASHVDSVHGQLGCVTCHGGTPETSEVGTAHEGLITDPSSRFEQTCLLCHRDLRDSETETLLHRPHRNILESPHIVECSACHGAVGHGFSRATGQPICSMAACLDCHEERELDIQSRDCGGCHVGPHDVAAALSCSDCHTSIRSWSETRLSVHPVSLTGQHATARCFECHRWPDFRSLDYVCADCHARPHDFGDDECAECHTTTGWDAGTLENHTFPINHGGADGTCGVCHRESDASHREPDASYRESDASYRESDASSYYCFTCHSCQGVVDSHEAQGVTSVFGRCTRCHSEGSEE